MMNVENQPDPDKKKSEGMASGLILIAVGVIFLVMQFTDLRLNNWWALFILIPVFVAWSRAFSIFSETGEFTQEAIQAVTGSLFPLLVASIFLFNWDWGQVWPGFIILAGVSALARGWGRQSD